MSQPYVLIKPYRQFQVGQVIEPGALLGDGLVKRATAIKVSPREVQTLADLAPGALPIFPDAALHKLMVDRGRAEPDRSDRKVTKTSLLKR